MFFVRTASADDLPIVAQILKDTWHDTYDAIYGSEYVNEINHVRHSVPNLTAQRDRVNSEFLVADNGQVVGGMAYASQKDKTITLHQIFVHPQYQSGKTGLHLLIEIENSFLDAASIELEVETKNEKAISFFKEYGFKPGEEITSIEESAEPISIVRMKKPMVYAED